MREILKPIFEWLTSNYNLFDNVVYNYFAMALVGVLAFGVAWGIVGFLYECDLISGRISGSIIHWVTRFITFIVIFTVISIVIFVIRFILTIPNWAWGIGVAVLAIVLVVRSFILRNRYDT